MKIRSLLSPNMPTREESLPSTNSKLTRLEQRSTEAVDAVIKSRTQMLRQSVLDGFLGLDNTDPHRVTRFIRKLLDHKPDTAVKLLTKLLPAISDDQLQKYQPQVAQIQIINNALPQSSTQVTARSLVLDHTPEIEDNILP